MSDLVGNPEDWFSHNEANIFRNKPLAILCSCTAWFVLDLVGKPGARLSHDMAHFI